MRTSESIQTQQRFVGFSKAQNQTHKTTGPKGGVFANCLFDENIKIRKRLFLTATQRHYDIWQRDREGDFRIISMDNETIYGPRAYTLTFGSAAYQVIICNYKIVISVVNGEEVNAFSLKHGITLVGGDVIGAKWIADQVAVQRAIEKAGAGRVITFHSRVSNAKEFGADTSRGMQQWIPDFAVFHVNGTQPTSERKELLQSFRVANKALITNARCLTEGIDVPAVDMVAFVDPRHGRTDIAQAVGRAMRKPNGSDKTTGYVVIPIFLQKITQETTEQALQRSDFDDVADILNAMPEQDEELMLIIRELTEARGRGEAFNPRMLSDKVEVLGLSIELSTLRASIFAEIVNRIGTSWDEMFGRLVLFKIREGHCSVPQDHVEGSYKLGRWVSKQRARKDDISAERKKRLDAIGFVWNSLESRWEEGIAALTTFIAREGHCYVPAAHLEGPFRLGTWVKTQRRQEAVMSAERRQQLDSIGFVWQPRENRWEKGFAALRIFRAREGHCDMPACSVEGTYELGRWVSSQRTNKDNISPERRKRLDAVGFLWDVLEGKWEEGFAALTTYKEREGHCNVPPEHVEGTVELGFWVRTQRGNKRAISVDRRRRLDNIEFVWRPFESAWENGFAALTTFKTREGHCNVPQNKVEGTFTLGKWVAKQRANKDNISAERRKRLDAIGFSWSVLKSGWEEGVAALKAFKAREGHCFVSQDHVEGSYKLGPWVSFQRCRERMPADRKWQLDAIGFSWNSLERWEEGFAALTAFKAREGHYYVPAAHLEGTFRLGSWVNRQRSKNTSAARRERLSAIGFLWDVLEAKWEEGFAALTIFRAREGHCCVPTAHVEVAYKLGMWVGAQRSKKDISAERRKRLDAIGFVWNARSQMGSGLPPVR
jgi:hypothetical protein